MQYTNIRYEINLISLFQDSRIFLEFLVTFARFLVTLNQNVGCVSPTKSVRDSYEGKMITKGFKGVSGKENFF